METRAAVLKAVPGKWEVETVELDPPRDHEVLVRIVAAGLCHSDDHFATGDITVGHLPFCGGHEAAGVVEAVGPGVRGLSVGDHHRDVVRPRLRALPLVRERNAGAVRQRRAHAPGQPARRDVPDAPRSTRTSPRRASCRRSPNTR